jgi:hypothetical protein
LSLSSARSIISPSVPPKPASLISSLLTMPTCSVALRWRLLREVGGGEVSGGGTDAPVVS